MEISDLNLSVRAFNAVCRAGIKTIPELYHKYQLEPEWLHREIGPKNMHEVGDALALHREEVWEENGKTEEPEPIKPGDFLIEYDPEIWGEEVTFDELAGMIGELVVVNFNWYPDDDLAEDGEGNVLRVWEAEVDTVWLAGDTPKRYEITRQAMDDHVHCRYCTKVWRIRPQEEESEIMPVKTENTLSIESPYFASMRLALDQMLQKTVDRMMRKASSDGTVTLKISLSLNDAMLQNGETIRQPVISHKITSSITSRETVDGFVAGDYALEFDEQVERYVLRELPPEGGQMTLF